MPKHNSRPKDPHSYISYADALDWVKDFANAYRCLVDWKLTVRREDDGSVGTYLTAFVRERGGDKRLIGHQVVRFGRDQETITVPAAMVKAIILLDRDLGARLDEDEDQDVSTGPAQPI